MFHIPKTEDASRSTDNAKPLVPELASATPVPTVEQLTAFHGRGLLSDDEFRLAQERVTPTETS